MSRLNGAKGESIFSAASLGALADRGARVVLVGTGDAKLEDTLHHASLRYPGVVAARITFDAALATRILRRRGFSSSSRFEPCGLTQLYAMRWRDPDRDEYGGISIDTFEPANLAVRHRTGFWSLRHRASWTFVANRRTHFPARKSSNATSKSTTLGDVLTNPVLVACASRFAGSTVMWRLSARPRSGSFLEAHRVSCVRPHGSKRDGTD